MTGQNDISGQYGQILPEREPLHALIRDVIAGKRTAQKELYNKYAPFVYGVIRRYIASEQTAKEILNDSFFKILTKAESYTFKGAFEGWMRTITVNTITDHVRKAIKHEQRHKDMPDADLPVEQEITALLSYKDLLKIVHELPDKQRIVFNLFVFEDFSHKDIALSLGMTENNSRWHLNDARRRLMEKIKHYM